MRDFKTLDVWRRAFDLSLAVYRVTSEMPADEKFGLTSQVRRAAVSVASNLAEGAGRESDRDFLRFVAIASGSVSEVKCQLMLCRELGFVPEVEAKQLETEVSEMSRMLHGLARHLKTRLN